ncbi:MAG: hypothetical protein AAF805_13980, partial [Planctomycetota bacterium]
LARSIPYSGRPGWLQHLTAVLYGVAGTRLMIVGLWTALADLPARLRWGGGLATAGLFSIIGMVNQLPMLSAVNIVAAIATALKALTLWASVGLVVRIVRRRFIGLAPRPRLGEGFRIADLLELTAALAIYSAAYSHTNNFLDHRLGSAFAWPTAMEFLLGVTQRVIPTLPVLWAAFPVGEWSWRNLLLAAAASWTLAVVAAMAVTTYYASQQTGLVFTPDYVGLAVRQLGVVLGVVGVAIWLRRAGYRLHAATASIDPQ